MAYLREGINAHVREYFDSRLQSSFIQRCPMLYFLGLRSAEGKGKLGQPKANAIFGGKDLGQAEIDAHLGDIERYFSYQKAENTDGAGVSYRGSTPTASVFAEDNAGQIATRYYHYMKPIKVGKHSLEMAKGEAAIGSILDRASAPVWNNLLKTINGLLWLGGTNDGLVSTTDMNSPTEQDKTLWVEPLGLKYTVGTTNNYYGRVNRTVETMLNPFAITASDLPNGTRVDLDINRYVNNGFTKASGGDFEGLANKNPNGMGCQLHLTTSALFNELASQADARGIRTITGGMPNHSVSGFQYPIIEHDNVWYTWDKDCPAGTMYHLDLDTFLMEVRKGHNFEFLGFVDKSKTEEGGGYYEWGNYSVQFRFSNRAPFLNGVTTGLTTS